MVPLVLYHRAIAVNGVGDVTGVNKNTSMRLHRVRVNEEPVVASRATVGFFGDQWLPITLFLSRFNPQPHAKGGEVKRATIRNRDHIILAIKDEPFTHLTLYASFGTSRSRTSRVICKVRAIAKGGRAEPLIQMEVENRHFLHQSLHFSLCNGFLKDGHLINQALKIWA